MKTRTKKITFPNGSYPRLTVRLDGELLARVDALKSRSDLSYGQIVAQCLRRHLPDLEKFHKV
jgi:hypothetical protein